LLGWFDDCIQISFALMKLNESKQIKPTNNKQTKKVVLYLFTEGKFKANQQMDGNEFDDCLI